ncbi:MAG: hypothetical protein HYS12_29420 [Planctomycetes bacterium]|nr:hypothetical protein [Planctomycetota bacterium]
MAEKKRSTVVGVFDTRAQAEQALDELRAAGFKDSHLTMVMHHSDQGIEVTDLDRAKAARVTGESKAEEGAAIGAAVGAVAGGLLGLLPGIGTILFWGPTLAAALFGLVAGAASGGISGALIGSDFPEKEARFYEAELKAGRVLVGVKVDGRYQDAVDILRRCEARDAASPQEAHAMV